MDGMMTGFHHYYKEEETPGRNKGEVIHSGHFMISSVADQDELEDEVSHDRDSPVHHDQAIRLRQGYDFSDVSKETQNTYQFGHRSTNQITIDASLSRLFECMSLAYRGGKVVSPKWKNFKGMRLTVKDKIRLNNAIWRTWHIQYIMKKKRNSISFVQFATPLDNESDCDSHSKPEAVVMEGKYWKRRIETVVAEYKKWRAFFMDKWVSNQSMPATPESISGSLDAIMKADDNMFADLADKLFRGLSQPFQFPNPREIAQHATNADMMQPGLLQLQPPIDDFMDPLDLDIFSPQRKPLTHHQNSFASLFHSNNSNVNHSIAQLDFPTPMFTSQDYEINEIREAEESSLEELVQRATTAHQENVVLSMANDVMRMQSERNVAPELPPLPTTQMPIQQNRDIGINDPIMSSNPLPNAMDLTPAQNPVLSTTMPMMVSKQQQDTPTISQIVISIPHHYPQAPQQDSLPIINNDTKRTMPPPQKAPPRRKSISRNQTNIAANPVMPNQMGFETATVPMCVAYTAPTKLQNVQVQAVIPQVREQMPQLIHHHQVVNQVVVPQAQMQMEQPQPMVQNVQSVHQHNVRNDGQMNLMSSAMQLKDGSSSTVPVFVPITVPQLLPSNHYSVVNEDQPPPKKQHLTNQQGIVVKQSSQTIPNSHHISARNQTLLTQLLTSGRQDVKDVKGASITELSPNAVINQAHEAQLKQVAAQAAHFNTFQNSVLLAAARATAPPSQPPTQNVAPRHVNATHTDAATEQKSYSRGVRNHSNLERGKLSDPPSPWLANSATSSPITSMDTDDGLSREDFVCELEEKSYSVASCATSADQKGHQYTAEQKRRCNIKSLCDRLHDILPDLKASPNPKMSKAVLLGKSCNYIKALQHSRTQTASEIQELKQKIDALNEDICNFQQQLPANGAPISRHRGERMRAVFDQWVRERTLREWKFFIFSMVIKPWFSSYNETVSNASVEEFCRTSLMWLEKHCSMLMLRRSVVDSLEELGTTTSILTDPGDLQQQAENAVQQTPR